MKANLVLTQEFIMINIALISTSVINSFFLSKQKNHLNMDLTIPSSHYSIMCGTGRELFWIQNYKK